MVTDWRQPNRGHHKISSWFHCHGSYGGAYLGCLVELAMGSVSSGMFRVRSLDTSTVMELSSAEDANQVQRCTLCSVRSFGLHPRIVWPRTLALPTTRMSTSPKRKSAQNGHVLQRPLGPSVAPNIQHCQHVPVMVDGSERSRLHFSLHFDCRTGPVGQACCEDLKAA